MERSDGVAPWPRFRLWLKRGYTLVETALKNRAGEPMHKGWNVSLEPARSKAAALAPAAPAPTLLERHKVALRSYVRALSVGDAKSVEAVVDAVWLEAQSAQNAEFEEDPTVWLFANARRRVVGSALRSPLANDDAGAAAEDEVSGEKEEPRVVVHRTVGLLTAKQQEALRLKFQFSFNLEEMAAITGQGKSATGGLLHHAMTRIGRSLGTRDDDDSPWAHDPRMTAYALDELDAAERKLFERAMANGKALVERGKAIRDWAGHVTQVLSSGAPVQKRRRKRRGGLAWWRHKWLWLGLCAVIAVLVYAVKRPRDAADPEPASRAGSDERPASAAIESNATRAERPVAQAGTGGAAVGGSSLTRIRRKAAEDNATGAVSAQAANDRGLLQEAAPRSIGVNGPTLSEDSTRRAAPEGDHTFLQPATASAGEAAHAAVPRDSREERERLAREAVRPDQRAVPAGDERVEATARSDTPSLGADGDLVLGGMRDLARDKPGKGKPSETVDATPGLGGLRRQLELKQWPERGQVPMGKLLGHVPAGRESAQESPVNARIETGPSPWDETKRMVRVVLQARESPLPARGPANLVFAVDVSKSMAGPNRLPLVQEGVRRLVDRLRPDDSIAVVTYAAKADLALGPTPAQHSGLVRRCLAGLEAAGLTNGSEGLRLAYATARANWKQDGMNVVVLCTDGNFNLGTTDDAALAAMVAAQARQGVRLSVFGFGRTDRNDLRLELLATSGEGRSCYVNTELEAERQLVEQIEGLFAPVAQHVQLQVHFNPEVVADFRRIGDGPDKEAESRADALLPGRSVTALFEITPAPRARGTDPLGELQFDYTRPEAGDRWQQKSVLPAWGPNMAPTSVEFRFALAMAEFGRILQGGQPGDASELNRLDDWVRANVTDDAGGYRTELLQNIELARAAVVVAASGAGPR
ncbi:MAG TPA: YfbK domain-containing protein [Lacunisphaera sp.]|nr:YfbK domain-containing protein [Lacunisphaera sp.]